MGRHSWHIGKVHCSMLVVGVTGCAKCGYGVRFMKITTLACHLNFMCIFISLSSKLKIIRNYMNLLSFSLFHTCSPS